jgi:nucleoside permease NupC
MSKFEILLIPIFAIVAVFVLYIFGGVIIAMILYPLTKKEKEQVKKRPKKWWRFW